MERKLNLFNDIGRKIEDELDFDFSVSEITGYLPIWVRYVFPASMIFRPWKRS